MSIISPAEGICYSYDGGPEKFNFKHRHLNYTYRRPIDLKASKELCDLLYELSYNAIKKKPENIFAFFHEHCEYLLKQRRQKKLKDRLNETSISHVTCSSCTFETDTSTNSLTFSKDTNEIISFRQQLLEFFKDNFDKNDFDEDKLTNIENKTLEYLTCSLDESQMQLLSDYILNDENESEVIKLFINTNTCKDDATDGNESILRKFKRNIMKYLKNNFLS